MHLFIAKVIFLESTCEMEYLLVLLFLLQVLAFATPDNPPVVELPNLGKIKGDFGKSLNGRSFYSFEGVPYARPPIGEHRFEVGYNFVYFLT